MQGFRIAAIFRTMIWFVSSLIGLGGGFLSVPMLTLVSGFTIELPWARVFLS